ncbi:hypothetical protein Goshw_010785, partial [Gossypium schwendimanii]|nr:hypothetical protein [Gossypium schwendimanii]
GSREKRPSQSVVIIVSPNSQRIVGNPNSQRVVNYSNSHRCRTTQGGRFVYLVVRFIRSFQQHPKNRSLAQTMLDILETTHDSLRMQEAKTIREFYAKLCDLSNQVFGLGEEYSDARLVRKVLRYLFERFSI